MFKGILFLVIPLNFILMLLHKLSESIRTIFLFGVDELCNLLRQLFLRFPHAGMKPCVNL